jgi:hypothetical protein
MQSIQNNITGENAGKSKKARPEGAWTYTVSQFCESAQISPSTFWKYVKSGKINVVRFAGRTLVTDAERKRLFHELV